MNEKSKEWLVLEVYLSTGVIVQSLKEQYFKRLIIVLNDKSSEIGDILTAYRDALKASSEEQAALTLVQEVVDSNRARLDVKSMAEAGLLYNDFLKKLSLITQPSILGLEQIEKVYQLAARRRIPQLPMDIALANRLSPDTSEGNPARYYRGGGQQVAIRTALQCKPGSTIVVNLPTGTGKTLVAHSLCLFSPPGKLTLVITPTIALAIEQARRAKEVLNEAGEATHNNYFFGGDQTPQQRQDIKDRIRSGQQRILFTSPESARGALLPSLFDAAKEKKLANIVVDEAHIVDQWGDDFRPDFQIFAAVTHALIRESSQTIKCVLMSATFTDANLDTLKNLFTLDDQDFIEVHSSFLRPEPQYQVKTLEPGDDYLKILKQALVELPRPLIIYALEPAKANQAMSFIRSLGFNRIECFTGETSTERRAKIISQWNDDEIDIIVATSAFGVGMDKADVRSILHVQPPENIDRFYQEVGRSGRDGSASQSLVIFQTGDLKTAQKINESTLITAKKGIARWRSLFSHRSTGLVESVVNLTNMRPGIDRNSRANESWNWRTLLLMQRSGLIQIEFARPERPPQWGSRSSVANFVTKENQFYEQYYQQIQITLLVDNHQEESCWENLVNPQRILEKERRRTGFDNLKSWLLNPKGISLCEMLYQQYTITGITPQKTCGGCPNCFELGKSYGNFPTLNFAPIVKKPNSDRGESCFLYYTTDHQTTLRKLIGNWRVWIQSLIEKEGVINIYSSSAIIKRLNISLPRGMTTFWANSTISQGESIEISGPSLIIIPPEHTKLPVISGDDVPYILLAPNDIPSPHFGRLWWQEYYTAQPLEHFMTARI